MEPLKRAAMKGSLEAFQGKLATQGGFQAPGQQLRLPSFPDPQAENPEDFPELPENLKRMLGGGKRTPPTE